PARLRTCTGAPAGISFAARGAPARPLARTPAGASRIRAAPGNVPRTPDGTGRTRPAARLRVRFRYYAEKGGAIWVQLFNDRVGDNFRYDVPHVAVGTWEAVEAPLAQFYRLTDRSSALLPGDPLTWFNIAAAGAGAFYFDDVEIAEVRP
ncbi:MAG: hypothetical protein ACK44W_03375, partial [Planctomycetota bacterium]